MHRCFTYTHPFCATTARSLFVPTGPHTLGYLCHDHRTFESLKAYFKKDELKVVVPTVTRTSLDKGVDTREEGKGEEKGRARKEPVRREAERDVIERARKRHVYNMRMGIVSVHLDMSTGSVSEAVIVKPKEVELRHLIEVPSLLSSAVKNLVHQLTDLSPAKLNQELRT
jgi:hypothetical protein